MIEIQGDLIEALLVERERAARLGSHTLTRPSIVSGLAQRCNGQFTHAFTLRRETERAQPNSTPHEQPGRARLHRWRQIWMIGTSESFPDRERIERNSKNSARADSGRKSGTLERSLQTQRGRPLGAIF